MILLSDNDLIVKLAQCDLIDDTLASLDAKKQDCFVLNSLSYSLRLRDPDKSIQKYVGSAQAYDRINELLESCSVLGESPLHYELLEHLQEIPEIDAGEQALFLHAFDQHVNSVSYRMLTGDKRALKAICNYDTLDAFEYLRTNIVCLESCMMDLIDYAGFDYVNDMVSCARPQVAIEKYDKVLRAAFGKERTQDHCLECLRTYSDDIRWLLSY